MAASSPYYPPVGFHFQVEFELDGASVRDASFQEVTGLSATVETVKLAEGGQNRFSHQLPVRASYEKISLKRGLVNDSALIRWCRDAIENFSFAPVNLTITLLNEQREPMAAWYVYNAYPVKWSVSSFNAQESNVAVETLELQFNYFNIL